MLPPVVDIVAQHTYYYVNGIVHNTMVSDTVDAKKGYYNIWNH